MKVYSSQLKSGNVIVLGHPHEEKPVVICSASVMEDGRMGLFVQEYGKPDADIFVWMVRGTHKVLRYRVSPEQMKNVATD
jgi:translation elongation factor P/translation initiation factor 5A